MDDEIKVISLLEKSFTFKRTTNTEQKSCYHYGVEVDEETRTVNCAKCGIVMDPFDYLKTTCYRNESAFNKYILLTAEVSKLEKRYNNLNKEIERLKSIKSKL